MVVMHPALEAVQRATIGTPFERAVWLVGGAVRDELLGKPVSNDFDLVLTGSAGELAELLHKKRISDILPVEYPRFGTAMVKVGDAAIELVTARKENYSKASRKPDVQPATLEEDARRRDFTVNALLKNLHSGEIWDPLRKGLEDIKLRVLRTPLEPDETFHDDPLRMLRAVRFRWQLGFDPAPGLYEAAKRESERLQIISAERIRDEFTKMLSLPTAPECMQDLLDLGLLPQFAPEFEAMVEVEQGSFHHLDVWDHTLLTLKNAGPDDLTVSLACLLHDVGKPPTRTVDHEGRTRFFSHEVVGAQMSREILRRLRFPSDEIEAVALLVKNHMRLGAAEKLSPPAARRLIRDLGAQLEGLIKLVEADASALKPGVRVLDLEPILASLENVRLATPAHKLVSPLSGEEIMQLTGLVSGPEIGKIKQMLVEHILDGTLIPDDKETAIKLVKAICPPTDN